MHRHGFQHVLDVVGQLLRILKAGGEDAVVDMDNLLKREALDVIGTSPGLLHNPYLLTSVLAFLRCLLCYREHCHGAKLC